MSYQVTITPTRFGYNVSIDCTTTRTAPLYGDEADARRPRPRLPWTERLYVGHVFTARGARRRVLRVTSRHLRALARRDHAESYTLP